MINCESVYVLKSGLFLDRWKMVEGATIKFLIKVNGKFYDLNGNAVSLFKSEKQICNLKGNFVFCDYYGNDSLLYKIYDKDKNLLSIDDVFFLEGFDLDSYSKTAKYMNLILKKMYKPFMAEIEVNGQSVTLPAYKAIKYQGFDKKWSINGGYSISTLKVIENYFNACQQFKNKAIKCKYKNANSQHLVEFEF